MTSRLLNLLHSSEVVLPSWTPLDDPLNRNPTSTPSIDCFSSIDQFGFNAQVLNDVSLRSNVSADLCYACSAFLYTDARVETTAALLRAQGISNLSVSTLYEKMFPAFKQVAKAMEDPWLTPQAKWLDHENNKQYRKIFDLRGVDVDIVGSVDTFPIRCISTVPGAFQPKYQEYVLKGLGACSHTGFVIAFSDAMYCGSSYDGFIFEIEAAREKSFANLPLFADGGFRTSPLLFKPFTGPQIWPKYLDAGQTVEQYHSTAEQRLEYNERLGFCRARIEHRFGLSGVGCFAGVMERRWRHSPHVLINCLKFLFICKNVDNEKEHGCGGCYHVRAPPPDEYFRSAKINRNRYPMPVPGQKGPAKRVKEWPLPAEKRPPPSKRGRGEDDDEEEYDNEEEHADEPLKDIAVTVVPEKEPRGEAGPQWQKKNIERINEALEKEDDNERWFLNKKVPNTKEFWKKIHASNMNSHKVVELAKQMGLLDDLFS